ncbi:hypothetical protein SAMN05444411_104180 [Lutibacter oricola]|uniref:Peptidase E n=1 Tax=Lutibacter oricola TaxID=762486 RepID=A0A1H3AN32_9FLAO|nr:DUF6702 family protein [Lutibacter oricola]SDX31140.1 hypothetical protein SAMN05444411_104180 [Lutibacter oricola]
MKFKQVFFLLITLPLLSFTLHKYYVSMCEIEYVQEQKSVQITLGLFIDDIEDTLDKDLNTVTNLATTSEIKNVDTLYYNYLKKHFNLTINNTVKNFTYIGKEYDDDIVRFYLEIENIEQLQQLEIKNTCLFNYFEEQQNIIKIKVKDYHKTFYLTKNNDKGLLKL